MGKFQLITSRENTQSKNLIVHVGTLHRGGGLAFHTHFLSQQFYFFFWYLIIWYSIHCLWNKLFGHVNKKLHCANSLDGFKSKFFKVIYFIFLARVCSGMNKVSHLVCNRRPFLICHIFNVFNIIMPLNGEKMYVQFGNNSIFWFFFVIRCKIVLIYVMK